MRTLMIWGVLAVCVLLVTPSYSDRTEDEGGEMKTVDFGHQNWPIRALTKRQTQENSNLLPCCRCGGRGPKACRSCPGVCGFGKSDHEPADGEQMKAMDSDYGDLTIRRLTKRDDSTRPCCRSIGQQNCKPCPGRHGSLAFDKARQRRETITDDQMKEMDSEYGDLTIRRLTKRDDSRQRCCRRIGQENCRPCPGYLGALASDKPRPHRETITDDQMKAMDSEYGVLTIRRLTKRDDSTRPCCRHIGQGNCKHCPGRLGSLGFDKTRQRRETITNDQMKAMDSEYGDLTIRRLTKRDVSKRPCCRSIGQESCKFCPGQRGSLAFGKIRARRETITDDQMKATDSVYGDLTIRRLTKRDDSTQRCCRYPRQRNCRQHCSGMYGFGRSYQGTETITDEQPYRPGSYGFGGSYGGTETITDEQPYRPGIYGFGGSYEGTETITDEQPYRPGRYGFGASYGGTETITDEQEIKS